MTATHLRANSFVPTAMNRKRSHVPASDWFANQQSVHSDSGQAVEIILRWR
jgi:hypothetical protein